MDNIGIHHIVQKLNKFTHEIDDRFKPCEALIEMADKGLKYY